MPPVRKPTDPSSPTDPAAGSSGPTTTAGTRRTTPVGSTSGGTEAAGSAATPADGGGGAMALGDATAAGAVVGGGCGTPGCLPFPCFGIEGIQPDNIRTCADAYYEGMFERVGAFGAIDELASRFVDGLQLNSDDLQSNLCSYMRHEPLRVAREDRHRVLRLFGDETLERLLVRLSDALIAFDLSREPAIALTPSALPEAATKLAVVAALEDLQLFLDALGGGGVRFITNEVGKQLMEILVILNDPKLRRHVQGNDVDDVFAVIAGLRKEKDGPTDLEAHQMARMACAGRKIFLAIADHVDGLLASAAGSTTNFGADVHAFAVGELDTIGGFAYEWRAAHGSLYGAVDEAAGADEEAADESRLQVIRLRRRATAS